MNAGDSSSSLLLVGITDAYHCLQALPNRASDDTEIAGSDIKGVSLAARSFAAGLIEGSTVLVSSSPLGLPHHLR
jgi:hypothetical protein